MNYDEFEDRLGDPDVSAVFRFWRIRCGPGVSPTKSAFYPDRLPFGIWPNLYLYERTDNGRILGVLSGTALVRHFGCDATKSRRHPPPNAGFYTALWCRSKPGEILRAKYR